MVPIDALANAGEAANKAVAALLGVVVKTRLVFVKLVVAAIFRIRDVWHYDVRPGHDTLLATVVGERLEIGRAHV